MIRRDHSGRARGALGLAALFFVVACGSTPPPKQLVDARMAYRHAEEGLAKDLAPADLDTAKQALAAAEESFNDVPEDQVTLDLAYIAQRKAQIADANARIEEAERRRTGADKAYRSKTEEELEKTRAQLDAEKRELANEREARKKAEQIAKAAMASLAEVAKVKEEKRGVVITLSGAVLFASGKATLLPIARQKISQVAKTLKDQGSPPIRIEGHTDSTGSQSQNRRLSKQRADAVRSHLVSQGYPSGKITTIGHGPDNPVADNSSAEGRANNRRVEIIVNPTD